MFAVIGWFLFLAVAVATGLAVLHRFQQARARWLIVGMGVVACTAGVVLFWNPSQDPERPTESPAALPHRDLDGRYASSSSCRSCHPREHASWHRSYHRTMTQEATSASVAGAFDGSILRSRSGMFRFVRDSDRFFVDVIPPVTARILQRSGAGDDLPSDARWNRHRIVMTTGSHHMQTYWAASGRGNELSHVPWYYHLAEQRWMPAEDSFLLPPDTPSEPKPWNGLCIVCHAVHGRPLPAPGNAGFSTRVVELGIACEACHGPGRVHVEQQQRLEKSGSVALPGGGTGIVNPARLSHRASSEICGQCHANFIPRDLVNWTKTGLGFRPGKMKLAESHRLVRYGGLEQGPPPDHSWGDGTNRTGGREFSAMIESTCYNRGKLSCLSCHSMHKSDPNDQLAERMEGNQACLQCHSKFRGRVERHTHHRAGSSGSRCYNCHMPHTSFALFKAIRSHRIDSPSAVVSRRSGRPNACNQCHLDRPLGWTARHLTDWYGQPKVELSDDQQRISATLLWALKGDASQRVVAAWTLGWKPAIAASGGDWQPAFLAALLDDPYSAVRFVAYRSLRSYPDFKRFEYDFVAAQPARRKAVDEALAIWRRNRFQRGDDGRILIDQQGRRKKTEIQRLLDQRDQRRVSFPE